MGYATNVFQVSLSNGISATFRLVDFDEDAVRYDAFYENVDLYKYLKLKDEDVTIDLNRSYSMTNRRYLLTTRRLEYPIVRIWGSKLVPHELNVMNDISEEEFCLDDDC